MKSNTWQNKYGRVEKGILKEIVIYRDRWLRGDAGHSRLLADGSRCCIGFMAAACGVPDRKLLNKVYIRQLTPVYQKMVLGDLSDDSIFTDGALATAYTLNDAITPSGESKEKAIKAFFKRVYNVKVTFKDVEPKNGG